MQEAFRVNDIDPTSGGYQPMFYAIAAAVIGGTALAGGSGTIIGAFLGSLVLGDPAGRIQPDRHQRQPAAASSSAARSWSP